MDPGNTFMPAVAPGAEAPALPTYAEVVESLGLRRHEIGRALYLEAARVPWSEALYETHRSHQDTDAMVAHARILIGT